MSEKPAKVEAAPVDPVAGAALADPTKKVKIT